MRGRRGVTLLELLMVVVIIGILGAVAIPQFIKAAERARMSEAMTLMASIRTAETRYRAEYGVYTATLTSLDFDPTDVAGTPMFSFTFDVPTSTITATRGATPAVGAPCAPSYAIRLTMGGTWRGRECTNTNP